MFQSLANRICAFFALPIACFALNEAVLLQKMEGECPDWMHEQIESDLAPFRDSGITSEKLDAIWKATDPKAKLLLRIKAQKGRIKTLAPAAIKDPVRFNAVISAFELLNRIKPLPDFDLIATMHDSYEGADPILTFAKNKNAPGAILIPDFEALGGYAPLTRKILNANIQYPWESKIKQGFWRGSSTGGTFTMENWMEMPRSKLVLASKLNGSEIDARFTSLVQMDKQTKSLLSAKGITGMFSGPTDQCRYRYLMEVDGNSCSYSRCYWQLLSNSVMIKQMSDNIQWYYRGIKPYEHFIPMANDLSDVFMQINWARSNDRESEAIAKRATEFALNQLSNEMVYLYLRRLIEEYATLYHVSP
jgi:hypothetical protein